MSFDLRTVIKDGKTGAVVKHQPYLAKLEKNKGTLYERPIGSGQWFDEQGNSVKVVEAAATVTVTEAKQTTETKETKK